MPRRLPLTLALLVPLVIVCLLVSQLSSPAGASSAPPAPPQAVVKVAPKLAPAGTPFPARGDDTTTSLGSFRIVVNPPFRPLLAGYPGYDPATGRLNSPTLYDPATVIGRSDPHTAGSLADTDGTLVGTAGTVVSDALFLIEPPNFIGMTNTREVHTEVRAFDLADMFALGLHVRAGTAAPPRPPSFGEVQSKSGPGGLPANDFPAESFFDVFVEVDMPPLAAFPGGTLYTPYPLVVMNDNLPTFPPKVVYVHGNSTAAPILFRNSSASDWAAGQLFGWLVLAGHGLNYGNSPADMTAFEQFMHTQREMPLPCSSFDFNSDGTLDLADIGLVAGAWHQPNAYNARYDASPAGTDGRIVIDDVQRAAACQGQTPAGQFDPLQIPAGGDMFESPPFQSAVVVTPSAPIPAGFFGTKGLTPSDPFSGVIVLQGQPLTNPTPIGSQAFQPVGQFDEVALLAKHGVLDRRQGSNSPDTVVERKSGMLLRDPLQPGGSATVPIELVALSLVSVQPIRVTYGPTQTPSLFQVTVTLPPGAQAQGSMTISRSGAFTGTFMSDLPVNSKVTFINVGGLVGTDQPAGPITRTDQFYSGMGAGSPLGPGFNTGAPTPWVVAPGASNGYTLAPPNLPLVTATVLLVPVTQTARINEIYTVSVMISGAQDLGAFEFTLTFSPTLVEIVTATLPAGNFLASTGRSVALPASPLISKTQGTLVFGAYSYGSQPGPNGSGTLAVVTMRARANGAASLNLLDTFTNPLQLTDTLGRSLGANGMDALVMIPWRISLPLLQR